MDKIQTSLPKVNSIENDKMDRRQCMENLKKIIDFFNTSNEGTVISLNGKWGTGKTTFLQMFETHLKNDGYKVLNFNSWENDDAPDPLIPIMAEFKNLKETAKSDNSKRNSETWGKVLNSTKIILPSIVGVASEFISGVNVQSLAESVINAINEYDNTKSEIKKFKEQLSAYVEEYCKDKPLIFLIDELDRCNPTFAVKTLERIKHLFEVPNIVYIIAIDNVQLCHSIRGYYGSEKFDAEDYLRRFFKYQYDLPQSNNPESLVEFALDNFNFASCKFSKRFEERREQLIKFIAMLYEIKQMSIRQLEQYSLNVCMILSKCEKIDFDPLAITLMLHVKMFSPHIFEEYTNKRISDNEIIKFFRENYVIDPSKVEIGPGLHRILMYEAVSEMLIVRYGPYENIKSIFYDNENLKLETKGFLEDEFEKHFKDRIDSLEPKRVTLDNLLKHLNLSCKF